MWEENIYFLAIEKKFKHIKRSCMVDSFDMVFLKWKEFIIPFMEVVIFEDARNSSKL